VLHTCARGRVLVGRYASVVPPDSPKLYGLEAGAAAIDEHCIALVPGLLQTDGLRTRGHRLTAGREAGSLSTGGSSFAGGEASCLSKLSRCSSVGTSKSSRSARSTSTGPARTVTEYDDHLFCLLTMNHHPLHMDAHYACPRPPSSGATSWSAITSSRLLLACRCPMCPARRSPTLRWSRCGT